MSSVSPSQASAGEEITAAKINTPVNQLAAGINSINDAQIVDVSGTKITDSTITAAKMATAAQPETRFSDSFFDHVASGLVWTGDAYGSTLAASMTAGVIYINGKRVTVAAVTARAFTASKDTYVDVGEDGVLDYTEVANNAASPALAASHIRVAIIVSGANIAAVGSVNQGQENKVLPIASSVPYAVTDSLGNLICPRDPSRKILGYRQITTAFTTASGTAVQITGLTCPVIVPTNRRIRVSLGSRIAYNTGAGNYAFVQLWDGTVGSGTILAENSFRDVGGSTGGTVTPAAIVTPTSSSKTYNASLHQVAGGTAGLQGNGATMPAFILVELV